LATWAFYVWKCTLLWVKEANPPIKFPLKKPPIKKKGRPISAWEWIVIHSQPHPNPKYFSNKLILIQILFYGGKSDPALFVLNYTLLQSTHI
jgi:hypothetical protein